MLINVVITYLNKVICFVYSFEFMIKQKLQLHVHQSIDL